MTAQQSLQLDLYLELLAALMIDPSQAEVSRFNTLLSHRNKAYKVLSAVSTPNEAQ